MAAIHQSPKFEDMQRTQMAVCRGTSPYCVYVHTDIHERTSVLSPTHRLSMYYRELHLLTCTIDRFAHTQTVCHTDLPLFAANIMLDSLRWGCCHKIFVPTKCRSGPLSSYHHGLGDPPRASALSLRWGRSFLLSKHVASA